MTFSKKYDLDIFSCFILAVLLWLSCLNLKEILHVQVWQHDALYYLSSYLVKLKGEGRWINYFLFPFLKAFPAHGSATLCVVLFGGFAYIAANTILPWKRALLFTLLLLQSSPVYALIHWPATPLPAQFFCSSAPACRENVAMNTSCRWPAFFSTARSTTCTTSFHSSTSPKSEQPESSSSLCCGGCCSMSSGTLPLSL